MLDDNARRELTTRLSRIEGQARGIQRMLDAGQEASAVLVQLMALQKATRAATTSLVKAQAIEHIREQVRAALSACPGNCDHCDELVALDRALAELDFDALLQAHLKVSE